MARDALCVLIVEDEPVIGMELEDAVTEAGHEVIGWATGHAGAMALAEARSPDLAFIDLKLHDGDTGLKFLSSWPNAGCLLPRRSAGQVSSTRWLAVRGRTRSCLRATMGHVGGPGKS